MDENHLNFSPGGQSLDPYDVRFGIHFDIECELQASKHRLLMKIEEGQTEVLKFLRMATPEMMMKMLS